MGNDGDARGAVTRLADFDRAGGMRRSHDHRPASKSILTPLLLLIVGCSGQDSAPLESSNGTSPMDAEATSDARPMDAEPGAFPASDAGMDGAGGSADGSDGDVPCTCEAFSICHVSECIDGACVERPVTDGTDCGELGMQICVAGACVMRGCGDGYRERGPEYPREGCDDGNDVDDDGCTPMCEPQVVEVASDPEGEWTVRLQSQSPAIGVDGAGRVLAVWLEDEFSDASLYARRYSPTGGALPSPDGDVFPIEENMGSPPSADPAVIGLPQGGWAVAWTSVRVSRDIVVRFLGPDGGLVQELVVNQERLGDQRTASLAVVGDDLVVAWYNSLPSEGDLLAGVRARRLSLDGAPRGGEFALATDRGVIEQEPRVAASGDQWIAVWEQYDVVASTRTIRARRFRGQEALDAMDVIVSPEGGAMPSVATLDDGSYVVAWVREGGIHARRIDAAPENPLTNPVIPIAEIEGKPAYSPSVAPLTGADFIVGFPYGIHYPAREMDFAVSPGATAAPEASTLRERIEFAILPRVASIALTPSRDGVWFAFTEPTSGGYDGLSIFHLPRE